MIFSPSVPSTGTNFLLGILGGEAWDLFETLRGKTINGKPPDVAILHLPTAAWLWEKVETFALTHRTIIPLRDPLLSVATALRVGQRDPMLNILGFEDIVTLDALTEVEFLPVDLPGVREAALESIAPGVVTNWLPVLSQGDYPLKREIAAGNVSSIPAGLWRALCSREARLRPLLERVGYRNLLWWS